MDIKSITKDYPTLFYTLLTLGLIQLSVWLYRVFSLLWRTVLGVRCTTARYGEGSWAVVTACSDRIGRASVKYLAG